MNLEAATRSDLDQILSQVHEISSWLKTKGIQQWSGSFPKEILAEEQSAGELFVCREGDQVIASVSLSRSPGDLWGDRPEKAMYLHRLVVDRKHAGRKLGQAIMALAEDEARAKGYQLLRLECDAKNEVLKSYYRSLGYQFRGVVHHAPYNMDFARFERLLT